MSGKAATLDGDSSDSDSERERQKRHKTSRVDKVSRPFFPPTFFTVSSNQLSDGTRVTGEGELAMEHTYYLWWAQKIYVTLAYPSSSQLGLWVGSAMQLVILLNVITGIVASSPEMLTQPSTCSADMRVCGTIDGVYNCACTPVPLEALSQIDQICFVIFAVDYGLRLVTGLAGPPRVANLLADDWDNGELELQRQTKRTHLREVERTLRTSVPPLPVTEENTRPLIFAKLLRLDHGKNGKRFYCRCSLHRKLTVIIMISMGRSPDTSIHELGSRQLEEFYSKLQRYEDEFRAEFRRQRGWCGPVQAPPKPDDSCGECSASGGGCGGGGDCATCQNPRPACQSDPACRQGRGGACTTAEDDDDDTDDGNGVGDVERGSSGNNTSGGSNNIKSSSSSSSSADVEVAVEEHVVRWATGMSMLEKAHPTRSLFCCTPVRNRLGLLEAWALEVDDHFERVCHESELDAETVAPDCSYECDRPRSDPDWPLLHRAVIFIFSVEHLIDLVSILPLFISEASTASTTGANSISTTFLRVVRCFRLLRVIQLNPSSAATLHLLRKTVLNSAEQLAYLLLIGIILAILYAFIIHQLERGDFSVQCLSSGSCYASGAFIRPTLSGQDVELSPFRSVSVSVYYVLVTMTTLGYGDM